MAAKLFPLAYFDSLHSGLVPVKVLSVKRSERFAGTLDIRVRVTAERSGYSRGYEFESTQLGIVPRSAVYWPRGASFPRIRPYSWNEFVDG